ncbi:MAG: U32 family peptidase [Methanobacteriaceae archaeon]|nr:U32 family peptidase [Methanobacteriaceae archaeon]
MSKLNIPELLAPAGSLDTLKAGVGAGADAVYLSGKKFGARQFARNFNLTEMEEAIEYAHLRGVKVYVTVNTLVKETELSTVGDYLLELYSLGADAVIVQDLGVARLAREIVPELDLHCSTQMTINNYQGVHWALDNGFKRVVLAREMHLENIEKAARKLKKKIELEVFAHGAICYSYSGQCLLSSFIGGRSGNRGMCAQPCRKNYQLIIAKADAYGKFEKIEKIPLKDHYLLSTRDLAIYSQLDRIVKAPVDSIKIEGRMKPPEYVANVVKVYREALDSLKKGEWKAEDEEILKLKMCFNRGLNNGWLLNNKKDTVMGRDNPGNRGLYLGTVTDYHKNLDEAIIHLVNRVNLQKGDGILFKDPRKTGPAANIWGTVLEYQPMIRKDKLFLKLHKSVQLGSQLFLTRRKSLVDAGEKMVKSPDLPRSIPLEVQIKWNKRFTPMVRVIASPPRLEEFIIELKSDFSMEKAEKRPLSRESIIKQLQKTGGTPFIINDIEMDYPGNLFTPVRNLNHLRREILEEVQQRIIETLKPPKEDVQSAKTRLHKWKLNYNSAKRMSGGELTTTESEYKKSKKKGLNLRKKWLENKELSNKELIDKEKTEEICDSLFDLAIYVNSIPSLKSALESGCRVIYFQPKIHEATAYNGKNGKSWKDFTCLKHSNDYKNYFEEIASYLKEASSLCNEYDAELIWKWPTITDEDFIKWAIRLLNRLTGTISGVDVAGLGALWSLKDDFGSLNLYGSAGLNIWNHMAIDELPSLNSVTLSPELSKDDLKKVINYSSFCGSEKIFSFIVQGNLEAVVSEDCLPCIIKEGEVLKRIKNTSYQSLGIKDPRNRIFPVELDENCRTHIFNSVELCLIDHIPPLLAMGVNRLIIDSRNKPPIYVKNILSLYQEALKLSILNVPDLEDRLNSCKKRVKKMSNGGITTGNFLRGVK